ncbi:hypothetical protein JCM11641_002147 [Rhodosporidiobolus odoratus]
MTRASSVGSAANQEGTPDPQGGGGVTGGLDEDDPLLTVDPEDPLVKQELEAFGTGAVEEPLPAPPVDPKAAAAAAAAASGPAPDGAAPAEGGKRTLAASGPLPRAKRPKNVKVSPAKTGKQLGRRGAAAGGEEVMMANNDFCDACGGKGHFLCCEGGCLRSFHFQCLEPPLEMDEVPEESWYCKSCRAAASPPEKLPRSFFSDLVYKVETENPKQFSLSNELKGFFKHVASGTSGEFLNAMEHRPPSKITGRAIGQEDRDGYRLKDKNGKSIVCYNCDGSAEPQKHRRIISCDFCDQHWHLDCLDPPMTGMPPPTRKWMCPLHSEHIVPNKRVPKTIQTIPVDYRDQPNNGDIVIVPSKEKGMEVDVEEMVVNRVRYQVPEQHVILDFWGRCKDGPRTRRKPTLKNQRNGRSPRKQAASGYDSGNSSPLSDLTSSDEEESDGEPSTSASAAPSALDNLALLAEVRYVDFLNSSAGANGIASTSKDKGKARAPPPALPASAQRRGPRPSLPLTLPGQSPAPGTPSASPAASATPRRGPSPSFSPATSGAPKLSEVTVETKEDLQALMRVRKMVKALTAAQGGDALKEGDAAKRAAMLGFLEGEPIIPKLGFIKADSQPWNRPWEPQRGGGGGVKPLNAHSLPLKKPTPSPVPLTSLPLPSPAPGPSRSPSLAAASTAAQPPTPAAVPSPSPAPMPLDLTAEDGALPTALSARTSDAPQSSAVQPTRSLLSASSTTSTTDAPLPFTLPGILAPKPAPTPVAASSSASTAATATATANGAPVPSQLQLQLQHQHHDDKMEVDDGQLASTPIPGLTLGVNAHGGGASAPS